MTKNDTPVPAPQITTSASTSVPLIAMVLGVVSLATFMWFLGVIAIIMGIIGLKKYDENKGFSVTAIVTGVISTILLFIVATFFFFMLIVGVLQSDEFEPSYDSRDDHHYRDSDEGLDYRGIQEGV